MGQEPGASMGQGVTLHWDQATQGCGQSARGWLWESWGSQQ